jgi:hypothetical protein
MFLESAKYAVKGSFDKAVIWGPILASIVTVFAASHFTNAVESIGLGLGCLVVSWFLIVIASVVYWPWRELRIVRQQVSVLEGGNSPLTASFDPANSSFTRPDNNPDPSPQFDELHGYFFYIEVGNIGSKTLEDVEIVYSFDGETNHHMAYGTAKKGVPLNPGRRKMIKLFFRPYRETINDTESSDMTRFAITVRATAKDAKESPDLRLAFEPTYADEHSEEGPYAVSIL